MPGSDPPAVKTLRASSARRRESAAVLTAYCTWTRAVTSAVGVSVVTCRRTLHREARAEHLDSRLYPDGCPWRGSRPRRGGDWRTSRPPSDSVRAALARGTAMFTNYRDKGRRRAPLSKHRRTLRRCHRTRRRSESGFNATTWPACDRVHRGVGGVPGPALVDLLLTRKLVVPA